MSSKLKPCPFCGGEVSLSEAEGMLGITCDEDSSCLGSGLLMVFPVEQRESAITAWNTRATIARLTAENERLKTVNSDLLLGGEIVDKMCEEVMDERDQLKNENERLKGEQGEQGEPVGFRYRTTNGPWEWMDESPYADGRIRHRDSSERLEPIYASQPAPVAVDLSALREYHAKAVSNLKSYAEDDGLRDSDTKHYTKRAAFHEEMVALIDKVKELNQ